MPFTPDMRRRVDQIRDYLYGGGYPDPLTNAEQLSFLFFFYMIEDIDRANLRQAKATGRPYGSLFAGEWAIRNPLNASSGEKGQIVPRDRMRWSSWANAMWRAARHLGARRGVPVLCRSRRRDPRRRRSARRRVRRLRRSRPRAPAYYLRSCSGSSKHENRKSCE